MPDSGSALESGLMIAKPKIACHVFHVFQPARLISQKRHNIHRRARARMIRSTLKERLCMTPHLRPESEARLETEVDIGSTNCKGRQRDQSVRCS